MGAWFAASFPEPTRPQELGWPPIAAGEHTLICAPTGSGKTLAAFLWSIDRLVTTPPPEDRKARTRVVYISPLRALAFDVEKNLRAPLSGIALAAERLAGESAGTDLGGLHLPDVGMRTGDTPAKERQAMLRRPPDLLITTPESLYLMLTSNAADTLVNVETVIVDEIHALAATKRGAHLAVSLERLEAITVTPPQRIGLSATQRPLAEVARFLGGWEAPGTPRDVAIVDAGISKPLEVDVVIPVEDMSDLGGPAPAPDVGLYGGPAIATPVPRRTSIWPSIYPRILEQILAHRSTIVFCNARRQAERLAAKLNELYIERVESGEIKPAGEAGKETRSTRTLANRAATWSRRTTGRSPASSGSSSRTSSSAATSGPSSPRAASSWASTWAPSISSCRSSRRAPCPAACSASAGPATRSASRAGARSIRSIVAISSRRRSWRGG